MDNNTGKGKGNGDGIHAQQWEVDHEIYLYQAYQPLQALLDLCVVKVQMEMDGGEGKSQFGGSNKRARTAAASEWDSQVFSDDDAQADVRTRLGAATLSGDTRKARTAGTLPPPPSAPALPSPPCCCMLHVLPEAIGEV